ncbi:MAG: lytic murein transglycosylase B [Cellvibrionaceae bacterium]|nr:lytic murein transglycosylase B [Cellvibrionaceae bacterium]
MITGLKNIGVAMLAISASLTSTLSVAENYAQHPQAIKLIDEMVAEHDFDRSELEALFTEAKKKQSILKAMSRPAEKALEWKDYRKLFLDGKRTPKGVEFWQKNQSALDAASEKYGVPQEIIVAIIGVETRYGRIMGGYRVLDALSTLAFDYPRRSEFFTKELKHFLRLTREQQQDPLALKGSYAGAMGYGQFMPSSFRSYAVDFDGDKVADIWKNKRDAIGSVANYFKHHGWRQGAPVVARAALEKNFQAELANQSLKPKYTVSSLGEAGFKAMIDLPGDEVSSLVKLEGAKGTEYWLGLHNFYVITRYNHSRMYAMAVYQLAQEIRKQYDLKKAKG